jgi:hypothetical protein
VRERERERERACVCVCQRTVVNQVRLCLRLLPIESVRGDLFEGLRALTALPASVLKSLSDRISVGLLTLLREHAAFVKLREDWRSLLSLIQVRHMYL